MVPAKIFETYQVPKSFPKDQDMEDNEFLDKI